MRRLWAFIAIFILSVMDALLTATGIRIGIIEEANPLLRDLLHTTPFTGAFMVILFVSAMLLIVYKYQHKIRFINHALVLLLMVKVGVIGLHIRWIIAI